MPILDQVINSLGRLVGRRRASVIHGAVVPVVGPRVVSFHVVDHRERAVAGRRPRSLGEEPAKQAGDLTLCVLVVQQLAVGHDDGTDAPRFQDAYGAHARGVRTRDLDLSVDGYILGWGLIGDEEPPHDLLAIEAEAPGAGAAQVGGDLVLAAAQRRRADTGERATRGVPHPGVSGRSKQIAGDGEDDGDIVPGGGAEAEELGHDLHAGVVSGSICIAHHLAHRHPLRRIFDAQG